MGKLIYTMNVSLDGYVETTDRALDWSIVDEELHSWFNDQTRSLDAELYGRRMYELMAAYWPGVESDPSATETEREFARIWNAMPRSSSRGPWRRSGRAVGWCRATWPIAWPRSGPSSPATLVWPERRPFLPALTDPIGLPLLETHTFGSGVVYLGYEAVR